MSINPRHASAFALLGALTAACETLPSNDEVAISRAALLGDWQISHVGSRRVARGLALTFNADGSMTGSVKCNGMSGTYEPLANRISMEVIITVAGCAPGWPSAIERAEKTLFSRTSVASLSKDGSRLYFRGPDIVQFRRAAPGVS